MRATWIGRFSRLLLVSLLGCSAPLASATNGEQGRAGDAAPPVDAGSAEAGAEASAMHADASPNDGGGQNPAYPAPHPDMPQVANAGGPVLANPRVVPVFFAGDALRASLTQFVDALAGSTYWSAATAEYGVGSLTAGPAVVVPEPLPTTITDADIAAWIVAQVGGAGDGGDAGLPVDGGGAWPAPDGNTIYTVFFPAGTTISIPGGALSCEGFGGYHYETAYAGGRIVYAVIPRCGSALPLTLVTSHELVEASTDPFPSSEPAYATGNYAGSGWSLLEGGEVGDMCVADPSSTIIPADIGFPVQRTWSNAAAAASRDPCVPAPATEDYFNAIPDLTTVQAQPGTFVAGVSAKPGATTNVAIHLFSDAPTSGPWALAATELQTTYLPPDPYGQLSFSFDQAQGRDGDVVHLTIARASLPDGGSATALPFQITSTLGAQSHVYFGVVGL